MSLLTDDNLLYAISEGSQVLREFIGDAKPVTGIILGSGLNAFADGLEDLRFLHFGSVPFMNVSTATGHRGRFALGRVPGTDRQVLCMQGRLHKYEGNSALDIALPVWLMHECGVDVLITTNAAGAINPEFNVGDFCLMTDMINLTGQNPLVGRSPDLIASRFVPMLNCFDPALREIALDVAERRDVALRQGVYLGLLGPSFETPAEIRMFASWGADTVAMSVVEEVIAARHVGMRVMGVSLITNMACGIDGSDPNEDDMMDVAGTCEEPFARLMRGVVAAL